MNLSQETINLAQSISQSIQIPKIVSIHLPEIVDNIEKPDEFGFVFLEDGSAGPFYTSLDNTLLELWKIFPEGKINQTDTLELISQLNSESHDLRAVALGAFNALSQHVISKANFIPEQAGNNMGLPELEPGQTIGMVGYFKPLIEKLLAQGIEILVLEKNPDRVILQPGITLSTDPTDLASCTQIICTASTLINGSLTELIDASGKSTSFNLIGPSGSGLPDILFNYGITSVGGIYFHDKPALHDALKNQQSWGHAGIKYQLTADNYPGISTLLKKIG